MVLLVLAEEELPRELCPTALASFSYLRLNEVGVPEESIHFSFRTWRTYTLGRHVVI